MRVKRLLLAVSLIAGVGLLVGSVAGLGSGCLFLAPALLLALPLLAGRYLGAESLSRIASARSPRRRALMLARGPLTWRLVPPRGGLLIAASLAVRPPPLSAAR